MVPARNRCTSPSSQNRSNTSFGALVFAPGGVDGFAAAGRGTAGARGGSAAPDGGVSTALAAAGLSGAAAEGAASTAAEAAGAGSATTGAGGGASVSAAAAALAAGAAAPRGKANTSKAASAPATSAPMPPTTIGVTRRRPTIDVRSRVKPGGAVVSDPLASVDARAGTASRPGDGGGARSGDDTAAGGGGVITAEGIVGNNPWAEARELATAEPGPGSLCLGSTRACASRSARCMLRASGQRSF